MLRTFTGVKEHSKKLHFNVNEQHVITISNNIVHLAVLSSKLCSMTNIAVIVQVFLLFKCLVTVLSVAVFFII